MPTIGEKAHKNKAIYNAKPEQIKTRTLQNQARALAEKAGLVKKGDGKNVNHKKMLAKGGTTTPGNIEVTTEKANKGWRKNNPEVYGK